MTEELHEIIRVLHLTTYDENEWDADNLNKIREIAHSAKVQGSRIESFRGNFDEVRFCSAWVLGVHNVAEGA